MAGAAVFPSPRSEHPSWCIKGKITPFPSDSGQTTTRRSTLQVSTPSCRTEAEKPRSPNADVRKPNRTPHIQTEKEAHASVPRYMNILVCKLIPSVASVYYSPSFLLPMRPKKDPNPGRVAPTPSRSCGSRGQISGCVGA